MEIKVDKEKKTLQVDNIIFEKEELNAVLIPSDSCGDDALRATYVKGGKKYIISVILSRAGKKYFEENNCLAELRVNNLGDAMFVWIYVPFKIFFNIIKYGTVDYLLEVIDQAI